MRPVRSAAGSPRRCWNWSRRARAPAEIAARLRVAAPVLLPGLGRRTALADRGGPGRVGGRRRRRRPGGTGLLEEILVDPRRRGPEPSDRIAVAHTGDEAVALVPLPAVSDGARGRLGDRAARR